MCVCVCVCVCVCQVGGWFSTGASVCDSSHFGDSEAKIHINTHFIRLDEKQGAIKFKLPTRLPSRLHDQTPSVPKLSPGRWRCTDLTSPDSISSTSLSSYTSFLKFCSFFFIWTLIPSANVSGARKSVLFNDALTDVCFATAKIWAPQVGLLFTEQLELAPSWQCASSASTEQDVEGQFF